MLLFSFENISTFIGVSNLRDFDYWICTFFVVYACSYFNIFRNEYVFMTISIREYTCNVCSIRFDLNKMLWFINRV